MKTTFDELGLNGNILAGVTSLGFTTPTPIQEQAIPSILSGRDVIGSAQTGTGKTAAFILPALQLLQDIPISKKDHGPHLLVITPTRELAQQINNVTSTICAYTHQSAMLAMGGTKLAGQIKALKKGCDVLVATPGRLLDLIENKNVDLSHVHIIALDEADRMLDMGFWPSVHQILETLPRKRQTLLFSATIPPSIKPMLESILNKPVQIEISHIGETASTVREHLCPVTQGQKEQLLKGILLAYKPERVLVFCRTKRRVDEVYKALRKANIKVESMHADKPQKMRQKALQRFREAKVQVLVATDVMSRGIDVSDIDTVVNFDVPLDPEDYVHRIGRTGRAGTAGQAFTFVAPDEISPLREIEYFVKKLIPLWDLPGFKYDTTRIIPNPDRSVARPSRTMFHGSRTRGRGPEGGRFGRHY